MKRLYTASLVLLALVLVGLSSCGETSLHQGLIGQWSGDPTLLSAFARTTDSTSTFHSLDLSVEDEQHLTIIIDCSAQTEVDDLRTSIRMTYYLACTYELRGQELSITPDEDQCRAEVTEYLIDGVPYVTVLHQRTEGKSEEEIQREATRVKGEMEQVMKVIFLSEFKKSGMEVFGTDLAIHNGVLSMRDAEDGICIFHPK